MIRNLILAVLFLPFVHAGAARAAPGAVLATPGALTSATAATFTPFEFVRDGQVTGFDIDLAGAIARHLKLQPVTVNMQFDGLIPALQGGRVDFINSAMYISPQRRQAVDFVPYLQVANVVMVSAARQGGITGNDLSLCGRQVAVTLGGIEEDNARDASARCVAAGHPALEVFSFPTAQDTAMNLRAGRVDAAFDSVYGAVTLMHEMPGVYTVMGRPFGTDAWIGFAVRKGDVAMRTMLADALHAVQADGTFAALLERWNLPPAENVHTDAQAPAVRGGLLRGLSICWGYFASWLFFRAAMMTLLVTVISLAAGCVIGLVAALAQSSRFRAVRALLAVYLWLFRGTPVLLQIVFVYNVLPGFGLRLSALMSAVLALSLNEGAYMAEIIRAGLRAIRPGQRVAALALGMTPFGVVRHIVAPQAFRVIVPMLGNQGIGMLKTSALVSVIAVEDLLLVANQAASASFHYLEALSAAGLYYLALTTLFMAGQAVLERRLDPAQRLAGGTLFARLSRMMGSMTDAR
ncbi:ABC transporter permease subunit [Komagataeibacter sp. FNDCF1]|uniref:ABC transporter permease subunit n=1 Tax=Komagataeibacter sp. FNDCF1 TaxID=2878681 RepID=UPI001E2FB0D3|nr:ABC transporter permease subunit [Komagataeibacter sp. FNDCF1]MCE2563245.1 ABC transporter permease subunit [Komagataeibacter sp. FNDCF1]